MTLDQLSSLLDYINAGGVLALLLIAVIALWRGWVVPRREVDEVRGTVKTQADTIDRLERTNDRLLDEIARPLSEVLAALPRRRS